MCFWEFSKLRNNGQKELKGSWVIGEQHLELHRRLVSVPHQLLLNTRSRHVYIQAQVGNVDSWARNKVSPHLLRKFRRNVIDTLEVYSSSGSWSQEADTICQKFPYLNKDDQLCRKQSTKNHHTIKKKQYCERKTQPKEKLIPKKQEQWRKYF